MLNRDKDLLLAVLVVAVSMLLPFTGTTSTAVRAFFAIPMVFIVPGYAFLEAFFAQNRKEVAERWAMTLGISLGLTMLAGFILNLTTSGLQYVSWALLLGAISFLFLFFALIRRMASAIRGGEQANPQTGIKFEPLTIIFVTASALIVIATVSFAQFGAASSSSPFTQFWMVPAGSSAAASTPSAQTTVTPTPTGQAQSLIVGIKSMEKGPTVYSVVVKVGNQVLKQWQGINLQPGQSWQETLPSTAALNQTTPIQAFLYKSDNPAQVYRTATWSPATK